MGTSRAHVDLAVAFTGEALRLQPFGGVARMAVELHRGLLAKDIETFIASSCSISQLTGPGDHLSDARLLRYSGRGATHVANLLGRRSDLARIRKLSAPWIVHRSYYGPSLGTSIPIVVTVFDMIAELYSAEYSWRDVTPRHKRQSVREASLVFAISETTKSDLIRLLECDPQKIRVLPLGVNPPAEETERRAAERATPGERPFVLYVGLRGGYKNFSAVLGALCVPALRGLDLVCFGGPPFTPAELATIDQHALTGRVRRVVGDDDLLGAHYRTTACFVYPSRYEGFGLPPLEAMIRGCPVVASNGGSIPEVLGDAAALIDPDDIDGFAAAIDRVLTDDDLRRERVLSGYQRASMFSWAKTTEIALAGYRALGF